MNNEDALEEINEISKKLLKHQHEYYVLSSSSISDKEYDSLFDRLVYLEKEFPELIPENSPTQRVGSDLSSELPETEHTIPVLSLDKVYSFDEIYNWAKKLEKNLDENLSFVLEEKIDGASVVLYYKDGLLKKAVTRGNGYTGNDITGNVKTIGSVPLQLSSPVTVAVRGEIFLPIKYFEEINSRMEVPYANPRNFASGTLRRVKSSQVSEIPLDLFVYEGYFETHFDSHLEILTRLGEFGFKLNPNFSFYSDSKKINISPEKHPNWFTGTMPDMESTIQMIQSKRKNLNYEIDGLVIKVNEISTREKLGHTDHHPRWAMAFKFESPEGVSEILKIDLQIGRTGRITPVARIKPVEISGSTVSNVTLHNQEYINILDLAIGDTVAVSKRGDIIPAVDRVIEKNRLGNKTWIMPGQCPACKTILELDGAHQFCKNNFCPEQIKGRIHFFVSRDNMDIDNLGPGTIDLLIKEKIINDVYDIYELTEDKLTGLQGMGEKKINLILNGIEKSKNRTFPVVLQSLGIPEIGQKVIEFLINEGYNNIDSLLEISRDKNIEILTTIKGIGEKTAQTLVNELGSDLVIERINKLRNNGLSFSISNNNDSHIRKQPVFENQKWCVTGSFEHFKPRDLAIDEIKKRKGIVVTGVTSKTTHILAGQSPGSKLKKAKELGIKIINENNFIDLISG